MDLRNLTIERIEELIDINERKQNTFRNIDHFTAVHYMNDLERVRAKLERALEWKLANSVNERETFAWYIAALTE